MFSPGAGVRGYDITGPDGITAGVNVNPIIPRLTDDGRAWKNSFVKPPIAGANS